MADENLLPDKTKLSRRDNWLSLGGILKEVYAECGGGEAYLRKKSAKTSMSEATSQAQPTTRKVGNRRHRPNSSAAN